MPVAAHVLPAASLTQSRPPGGPRSASNYLLGLSPLRFAPYISGTLAGMAVWSTVYASIGGAGRAALQSGVEPDVLLGGAHDCVRGCPRPCVGHTRLVSRASEEAQLGCGPPHRRALLRCCRAGTVHGMLGTAGRTACSGRTAA